jgi:hypothetical protein
MASPLLKLPAELRNMLWEYTLTSDTGTLRYDLVTKRFGVLRIGAGLSTTCRSISAEKLYTPIRWDTLVFALASWTDGNLRVLLSRLEALEHAMQYGLKLDLRIEGLTEINER